MNFKYQNIVLGGTFDCLHLGHKHLLDKAFGLAEFVIIGLTSDKLNRKRRKITWESETDRRKSLDDYLKKRGFRNRYKIILLEDIFGSSPSNTGIKAIITTKETLKNVKEVNVIRVRKGLNKLSIVMVNHIKDHTGKSISSSRIRSGQISPNGEIYKDLLLKIAGYKLSDQILNKFKSPLGKVAHVIPAHAGIQLITVGDITTQKFLEHGITPKLSIIDFKTRRHKIPNQVRNDVHILRVKNQSGTISKELIFAVEKVVRKSSNHMILVEGEEDLATIPAILLSPFGTRVYYGQPKMGMVEVIVNREIKDRICSQLNL